MNYIKLRYCSLNLILTVHNNNTPLAEITRRVEFFIYIGTDIFAHL